MFRVLTSCVQEPLYFLLCSDHNCGAQATATADLTRGKQGEKVQQDFMSDAIKHGWFLGLDVQFCPMHAQAMRDKVRTEQLDREDVEKKKQAMIAVPGLSVVEKLSREDRKTAEELIQIAQIIKSGR